MIQCACVLGLLVLEPQRRLRDVAYYGLLAYQAALVFGGRTRWIWVGALVAFSAGSLVVYLGPARLGEELSPTSQSASQ